MADGSAGAEELIDQVLDSVSGLTILRRSPHNTVSTVQATTVVQLRARRHDWGAMAATGPGA
ncbi:hypothetical protein [Mycobacterium sp. 141]|uniref:hypothetical protein n=1 Tax=Mycobacterium sp. 141 TaxID=1120797 RepID=UPI0003646ADF|nr:hypothetical protein [Mycobacterium sp. 141]